MLPHPTHDRLIALGLAGMAKAFEEQRQQPAVASLMFEERIGLLVDREAVERESRRLVTRLKFANLRQTATIEDLNTKAARGLDKALFAKLATGDWISRRQDLLITGNKDLTGIFVADAGYISKDLERDFIHRTQTNPVCQTESQYEKNRYCI